MNKKIIAWLLLAALLGGCAPAGPGESVSAGTESTAAETTAAPEMTAAETAATETAAPAPLTGAAKAAADSLETRKAAALKRYFTNPSDKLGTAWGDFANVLVLLTQGGKGELASARLAAACAAYPPADSNVNLLFDSYFCMNLLLRSYFGYRDQLSAEAREAASDYFLKHLTLSSHLAETEEATGEDGYIIRDSENHHIVQRASFLLGARLLIEEGRGEETLADGATVREHYDAWCGYLARYLSIRGRYGISAESGSPTYLKYTVDSLLGLYDFSGDEEVSRLAGCALDALLTEAVLETSAYVRGGAKNRTYKGNYSIRPLQDASVRYLALYFNVQNGGSAITLHPAMLSAAASGYRPPDVLFDLACGERELPYTFTVALPAASTRTSPAAGRFIHVFTNPGYALKTTYVTKDYVLGTMTIDRAGVYSQLHTQNKWMGVVFSGKIAGDFDHRLFFTGASDDTTGYAEMNAVSAGSAMIVAWQPEATGTSEFCLYLSSALAKNVVERDGWLLLQDPGTGAYAAVRSAHDAPVVVKASYNGGVLYGFRDKIRTAVVQCAQAADYASLDDFAAAVLACDFSYDSGTRLTSFTSLDGTVLTLSGKKEILPTIGGEAVDLAPALLYDAPYVKSEYGSGLVTITDTAGRTCEIDFRLRT